MIPDLEYSDYMVFLFSIPAALCVLLPCLPAIIISFLRHKKIEKKFKFSIVSCAFAYGITLIILGIFSAPFMLINTLLAPKWQMIGGQQYENFAYFFMNGERFISELLFVPLVVVFSIIVPFKMVKTWQQLERKAC